MRVNPPVAPFVRGENLVGSAPSRPPLRRGDTGGYTGAGLPGIHGRCRSKIRVRFDEQINATSRYRALQSGEQRHFPSLTVGKSIVTPQREQLLSRGIPHSLRRPIRSSSRSLQRGPNCTRHSRLRIARPSTGRETAKPVQVVRAKALVETIPVSAQKSASRPPAKSRRTSRKTLIARRVPGRDKSSEHGLKPCRPCHLNRRD
jgi:hypothetical protein